jgi:DNA-binding MarR family transcriptional regulator
VRPLTRIPHPEDRRSVLVQLTPAGRALVDDAVTAHVANERQLLGGLDEQELAAFEALLRKLLGNLERPAKIGSGGG